jgi:hypothetical protein
MPLAAEVEKEIRHTEEICRAFLFGLQFIISDTARDPDYFDNHLLSYASQDFIQSVVAIPLLVREGVHNACRRELRFVMEMSIKLCRIQQEQPSSTVAAKLESLKRILDTTNISIQNQINLNLLPEAVRADFTRSVGRLYGNASQYVHLTHAQVLERIALVEAGRTSGRENAEDIQTLNLMISKGLALSMVFIFHAAPEYVAGDLLVQHDGSSLNWFFGGSKYIAAIDEQFDYKAERQKKLDEIKRKRLERITF